MFQSLTMDERVVFETMINDAHAATIKTRDQWAKAGGVLGAGSWDETIKQAKYNYAQILSEQTQIIIDLRNSVPECADGS